MRVRAGMSVREVADALERPHSTYASYEDKYKKSFLPMDLVRPLVKIFGKRGIPASEVLALAGIGDEEFAPLEEEPLEANVGGVREGPRSLSGSRNVPIVGTIYCGDDGLFEIHGDEIIGYAKRFPRLIGMRNVYVVYVAGDSMSPWREPGDMAYVNPNQPPRLLDYVIVQLKLREDGKVPIAYLKRLVGRTSVKLHLLQYNPRKEIEIAIAKVVSIHRVMDWPELVEA